MPALGASLFMCHSLMLKMMKGPARELIPIDAEVSFAFPGKTKPVGVHLLISGKQSAYEIKNGRMHLNVPGIINHEIVLVDSM